MSLTLSETRSSGGRGLFGGRGLGRGTRVPGCAARALALLALGLFSLDAAAQIDWSPHRYSKEGLEINGAGPVPLPELRVTVGIAYSFGDRVSVTVPGAADNPGEGGPFVSCNDGSTMTYVNRSGDTFNFSANGEVQPDVGATCSFFSMYAAASSVLAGAVARYEARCVECADPFETGQTGPTVSAAQLRFSVQQLFDAQIDAASGNKLFLPGNDSTTTDRAVITVADDYSLLGEGSFEVPVRVDRYEFAIAGDFSFTNCTPAEVSAAVSAPGNLAFVTGNCSGAVFANAGGLPGQEQGPLVITVPGSRLLKATAFGGTVQLDYSLIANNDVTGSSILTALLGEWNAQDNLPPALQNPGNQTSPVNEPANLQMDASDPERDPLVFSAQGLPEGLTISANTGAINGTPTVVGSYAVAVSVTDNVNEPVAVEFQWVITGGGVNGAPTVTNPGDQTSLRNVATSLQIAATDPDGDPLSYAAQNLPVGLAINAQSGLISGTPVLAGVSAVTVTVTDGRGDPVAVNFQWTVQDSNTPPTVTNPGDQNSPRGVPASLQILAADPDGDTLTYAAQNLPVGLAINAQSGLISGTPVLAGVSAVTVTVTDGRGDPVAVNFQWTVRDANSPPTIATPAHQSSALGASVALQIAASDPDGDPLSYSAVGLPPGLSIDAGTGLISGTPGVAGTYPNAVVTVTDGRDGHDVATQSFTWFVNGPPTALIAGGNRSIPDSDNAPGERVAFDGTGSRDPDGAIAAYEWSVNGQVVAGASGPTPTLSLPDGFSPVSLVVVDDRGLRSTPATVGITVQTRNAAPVAVIAGGDRTIADSDNRPGEIVEFDGRGSSDPDGEIVFYRWFVNGEPRDAGPGVTTRAFELPDGVNVVSLVVEDNRGLESAPAAVTITVRGNTAPTAAIAGGNRTVEDSDNRPGEAVAFDGSASRDPDGTIASYEWSVNGQVVAGAAGAAPTLDLPDGVNTVALTVTDNLGARSTPAAVTVTVRANTPPTAAIAGGNRTVEDSDNRPGEAVTFDGSGSRDPDGTIASYEWSVNGQLVPGATGATPTLNLADGTSTVSLVVVDNRGARSAPASVTISVRANVPPTAALAGGDRTQPDTDGVAGETVTVDGSGSRDPDGTIGSYRWSVNGQPVPSASGPQPSLRLADGSNTVSLVVVDNVGATSAPASVAITVVAANKAPVPSIEGGDREIPDGDDQPGAIVAFQGSATDADGTVDVATFRWSVNDQLIASANGRADPALPLQQGENTVTLTVTDDRGGVGSTSVRVTIGPPNQISDLPDLTDNQQSAGEATETVCSALLRRDPSTLTPDEQDLRRTCELLFQNADNEAIVTDALQQISGEQISAQQTTGIDFSMTQLTNIGARLRALRQGAKGFSVAGLNLSLPGEHAPSLAALTELGRLLLGEGGASGDEEGGLLDNRLGIFVNGSLRWGDKDATRNETGFDFDSKGLTIGADYRFSDALVAGLALGYGRTSADFDGGGGEQDSDGLSGTVYGSWYGERGYLDGVLTWGSVSYDSVRNLDITGLGITDVLRSETDGSQLAIGASGGWDFGKGAFHFGPTATINYIQVDVDGFRETAEGSSGLAMVFGDQSADSLTVRLGGQLSYSFSRTWGILSPHARFDLVREFQNDAESISVRYANDPFIGEPGQAGGTFVIFTDNPDENYFIWAAGLSAQFARGFSGFVDYESITGLDTITSGELTLGLRYETKFR